MVLYKHTLKYETKTKTILDLMNLYRNQNLNLEPGFQRKSVWQNSHRKKLIESIIHNYPIPAIYLYRQYTNGHIIYDVIDGKQRLETIFRFTGLMRPMFSAPVQLPESDDVTAVDWKLLVRKKLQPLITAYEIPVIEVDGEMAEIVDLFVRINSTGKALTPQEKRHAKYYNSPFLKEAARLARRYETYFFENNILTKNHINRMKHVELICELMLSIIQGDPLNKKTALDRVMNTRSFDNRQLKKASRLTTTALNRVKRMFPHLKTTRFRQVPDFYTLVVLIGKFEQEKLILSNIQRNRLAWDLLKLFSNGVDEVRQKQKNIRSARRDQSLYREYLLTVIESTDSISQRRKRQELLRGLLASIFARKSLQRTFSVEQRRILWNSADSKICKYPDCSKTLTWDDFTIDHVDPYSKGGKTVLRNAAIMCREHNSGKGARIATARRKSLKAAKR